MNSYRDLAVWQKSIDFVVETYRATENFPRPEIYGLTSQIRRAATSIPANLAEGYSRKSRKEYIQFVRIAFASGAELETHLLVAGKLGFLAQTQSDKTTSALSEIMRMLNGLNQEPRRKRTGYGRKAWASVPKAELEVLPRRLPLVFHVSPYRIPVPTVADGRQVVAIAPELASPEFAAQFRKPPEELPRRDALEHAHDPASGVLRVERTKQVDMVLVGAYPLEFDLVTLRDLSGDFQNCLLDIGRQERLAVFHGKDDVIVRVVDAVVAPNEAHAFSITENRGFSDFPTRFPRQAAGNS